MTINSTQLNLTPFRTSDPKMKLYPYVRLQRKFWLCPCPDYHCRRKPEGAPPPLNTPVSPTTNIRFNQHPLLSLYLSGIYTNMSLLPSDCRRCGPVFRRRHRSCISRSTDFAFPRTDCRNSTSATTENISSRPTILPSSA